MWKEACRLKSVTFEKRVRGLDRMKKEAAGQLASRFCETKRGTRPQLKSIRILFDENVHRSPWKSQSSLLSFGLFLATFGDFLGEHIIITCPELGPSKENSILPECSMLAGVPLFVSVTLQTSRFARVGYILTLSRWVHCFRSFSTCDPQQSLWPCLLLVYPRKMNRQTLA